MKKTIYTVTFDNEVLIILDNSIDLKDYIYEEFQKDLSEEFDRCVERNEVLDLCHEIGVNYQKHEIRI